MHAAGKQGALTLSAKLAPALTAKALPYLPGIGLAYDCYNITTGVVELGNGLLSMAKGKKPKGPSALPQAGQNKPGNSSGGNGGGNNGGGKHPGDGRKGPGPGETGLAYTAYKKARKAADDLMEWANFKKLDWVKRDLIPVKSNPGALEIPKGKIPNAIDTLPRNTKFFSNDGLHKGSIEVWRGKDRGDHLGEWEVLWNGTIGKMLKGPRFDRKL